MYQRFRLMFAAALVACLVPAVFATPIGFKQTNLASDVPGLALSTDPDLVNAWGIAASAGSPFWLGANGTGKSVLYNGAGIKQGLIVTIPGDGSVTGVAFGNVAGSFNSDTFLFASEDGTVSGWRGALGTTAETLVSASAVNVYKGLANATIGGNEYVYLANFRSGSIDVLKGNAGAPGLPGTFIDPNLPAGFAPFNVLNLGGVLYVTYAKQDAAKHDDVPGPGNGFVNKFDLQGNLLGRLITGGALNSPWGMAMAPAGFGDVGGDLLVGNFGDGRINAYNSTTGAFVETLTDLGGDPLVIDGLWGLQFGNGSGSGPTSTLYFTAGPDGESHGLFGQLTLAAPPVIKKSFGAATIPVGGTTNLSFTLTNSNATVVLNGVGFTDSLPPGIRAIGPVTSVGCPAAAMTFTASSVSASGITLPAMGACTFTLPVMGTIAGIQNNVTSTVTSIEGGLGAPASASIAVVNPPTISKSFGAVAIPVGGTTNLSFILTNPNATLVLNGVGFTDNLPSGIVATGPVTSVGCPAAAMTFTASSVGASGITLPALGSCTFTLPVMGTVGGVQNNVTSPVVSAEGGLGNTAAASLTVIAPPTITKSFGTVAIPVGATTSLRFTILNPNATVSLTVSFTDTLPPGLVVATPNGVTGSCGAGIITAVSGSSVISLTNGTLSAAASCTVSVNVIGLVEGTSINSVTVTSLEGGTGNTASASITAGAVVQTRYASNLQIGDSVINISNVGTSSTAAFPNQNGNICVNVYTFSPDEQLISCCSCPVTPDGLVSLSARNDLISNTLTPGVPTSVVIKLLASAGTSCNASTVGAGANALATGMAAWGTTIHALPVTPGSPATTYGETETKFANATLSVAELTRITTLCGFIQSNGSGFGICKSCRFGGLGTVQP